MSEPAPPPQSPPSPFDRPGGQAPIHPGRPGVRKPLLLGCGALLALLGVTMVLFVVYQDMIAGWMFEAMHTELESKLPEDLPPEVRARYQDAFELAVASAKEGDYDATDLQRVQREFTRLAGESRMSVEEVERLAGILEEIPDRGE